MPLPTYTTLLTPFCATGDKDPVPTTPVKDHANMPDGFPLSKETPIANGGSYVLRKETNGVFNLLSQFINFANLGGKVQFDQNVVYNGGYSKGAVLFYNNPIDITKSTYCISLIDNNVQELPSTGPDGVNWAALNNNPNNISYYQDIQLSNTWYITIDNVVGITPNKLVLIGGVLSDFVAEGSNISAIGKFPISVTNVIWANVSGYIKYETDNPGYVFVSPLRWIPNNSITTYINVIGSALGDAMGFNPPDEGGTFFVLATI